METKQRRGTLDEALTNLQAPPPLPRKVWVIARNLWRRVILRQNCCGHPGEPGC